MAGLSDPNGFIVQNHFSKGILHTNTGVEKAITANVQREKKENRKQCMQKFSTKMRRITEFVKTVHIKTLLIVPANQYICRKHTINITVQYQHENTLQLKSQLDGMLWERQERRASYSNHVSTQYV